MKITNGEWKCDATVTIMLDNGKEVKRKVRYGSLDGMYVVIDGEKVGGKALQDKAKERCRGCAYLVEGDCGEWMCDDCGKEIHEIPDAECSGEQEW